MHGVSRVAAGVFSAMLCGMSETHKKSSRRGTDVRRRQHQVGVRLLPEELEQLRVRAEREGVSPAEVLRRSFLATA